MIFHFYLLYSCLEELKRDLTIINNVLFCVFFLGGGGGGGGGENNN